MEEKKEARQKRNREKLATADWEWQNFMLRGVLIANVCSPL